MRDDLNWLDDCQRLIESFTIVTQICLLRLSRSKSFSESSTAIGSTAGTENIFFVGNDCRLKSLVATLSSQFKVRRKTRLDSGPCVGAISLSRRRSH